MRLLLGFLVATALMAVAPAARATQYPGQEPAPTVITGIVGQAGAFWRERGLASCPDGVTAWEAPDLDGPDGSAWGRGDGATCEIWVARSLVRQVNNPFWLGSAIEACTAVAHEVGHAYGLGHTPTGLMAVTGAPDRLYGWSPQFCFPWARLDYAAVLRGDGEDERHVHRMVRYAMRLIRAA
jgi:hypothetical protein